MILADRPQSAYSINPVLLFADLNLTSETSVLEQIAERRYARRRQTILAAVRRCGLGDKIWWWGVGGGKRRSSGGGGVDPCQPSCAALRRSSFLMQNTRGLQSHLQFKQLFFSSAKWSFSKNIPLLTTQFASFLESFQQSTFSNQMKSNIQQLHNWHLDHLCFSATRKLPL